MEYILIAVIIILISVSVVFLYFFKREREKSRKEKHRLQKDLSALINAWGEVNVYQLDEQHRYIHFNEFHRREMKRVFGNDIAPGENKIMMLPESYRKVYEKIYDRAFGGGFFEHTQKFGVDFIKFELSPNLENDGKVGSITVVAYNVTKQMQHDKELEEYRSELEQLVEKRSKNIIAQRNFFQQIIDQVQSAVFVRDPKGGYTLVNKEFVSSMGLASGDQILGRSIFEVHSNKAEAELFYDEDLDILKNDSVFSTESKVDKNGKTQWYFLTKKRVEIFGEYQVLGVQTNITYLKETQIALEQTNSDLKNALEEVKGFQLKLIESEKLATVGQLTAGLIHEINNPINYVSGNVEPIRRDLADIRKWLQEAKISQEDPGEVELTFTEVEGLLKGIEEGASRVKSLMMSLKSLSRPDASETVSFNINQGLKSTLDLIVPSAKGRISFETDLGEVEDIECNPGQIQQVFLNVLDNAIESIADKGVIEVVSGKRNGKNYVRVSDNGTGISEKDLSNVFEPFFTTKESGHGTGLGLSIALRIVKEHGGSIQILSSDQSGTTIEVLIPY